MNCINKEWIDLINKYEFAGAREKFEEICTILFKKVFAGQNVQNVDARKGDEGIDIFVGEIGEEPVTVIQCKFFLSGVGKSQKSQIRNSFKTAVSSPNFKVKDWALCLINKLTIEEHKWWSGWKKKMCEQYALPDHNFTLYTGDNLLQLITENGLYNQVFEKEDSIKLAELHQHFLPTLSLNSLQTRFRGTSIYMSRLKNYFGNKPETHINRPQVQTIINWVRDELPRNLKNILTVVGEKGTGKTVIIKEVYENLVTSGELVLCIKADKYYDISPSGLEGKLFVNNQVTFTKIKDFIQKEQKSFVLIIDQLDALSQTLSSNREYLHTYNRVIADFEDAENVKIIISIRSFDLNFDADLSVYDDNSYKKIKLDKLSKNEVTSVLKQFNVTQPPPNLISLLQTPNHLEIFTRLPNKNSIKNDGFSSLKSLYDELWKELISSREELKAKMLLYKIANEMYENEQKIIVQNKFNDGYFHELSYLKSNQILIEDNNEIQFFHQTLYDYCFSRQFIDNGNKLQSYILENGQSIYIRSVIKMIVEYLRDANLKEFIDTLELILKSNKYRYHIKSLILSVLGTVQTPCVKEKKLVKEHILYNDELSDTFVNSIHSRGWLMFILEESFFDNNNLNQKDYSLQFFRKNISYYPTGTMRYLDELDNLENKHAFMELVLSYNENWESSELLPYFERYITYDNDDNKRNLWYFDTLTKIAEHHLGFAFEKFKMILHSTYNHSLIDSRIDYHLAALIATLETRGNSTRVFDNLLEFYNKLIDTNRASKGYDKINSPLYSSYKLHPLSFSKSGKETIEDYLLKYITNLASQESKFIQFFDEQKKSDSILLLSLLLEGLKINPNAYSAQIFELIQIIGSKNGLKAYDDNFQFAIRKLIGITFIHLTEKQQSEIIDIIETVATPNELSTYSPSANLDEKKIRNCIGKKKYLFLKALPLEVLEKYPTTYKIFQELNRKFGTIACDKPVDAPQVIFGSVKPPLPPAAYEKMDLDDWKNSMLKYNEDYKGEFFSLIGGLEQHAKAFSTAVKKCPQQYVPFINELLELKEISKIYVLYGLEGLLAGQYDIFYTQKVFKELIKVDFHYNYRYNLISLADKIIEKGGLDDEIFSYLRDIVEHKKKIKEFVEDNNTITGSSTSIRGDAAIAIINCNQYREYGDLIFQTIENAIKEKNTIINLSIVSNLAYLNRLNLERAFRVFLKLVDTDNLEILKNSLCSSQYFNNAFHWEMRSYFNKMMQYPELHNKGRIIILSWLNEEINDKELYDTFVAKSNDAKICAINIAEHNLFESPEKLNKKSQSILYQFLGEEEIENEETFSFTYSGLILRQFKDEKQFPILFDFLEQYSLSKHCRRSPAYFLEYLTKCSKIYPLECLRLLMNMDFTAIPNIQNSGYYRDEPIQLLLAIYSVLSRKPQLYSDSINESLDLFDKLMKHNHLRESANATIELILE